MRVRLKIALPIIGLVLFGAESYRSFRADRELERTPGRYFWWSSIRLDSEPANERKKDMTSCKDAQENCTHWELREEWVDPGLGAAFLMASAFPAFFIGWFLVGGLGKLGVSQVSSFMLVMPVPIFAWYYFIGWLLDGWIHRWSRRSTPAPD